MIPSWLTSWYQQNEQQQQLQEPFNDQYETADDWVEVITPSMKKRQQDVQVDVVPEPVSVKKNKTESIDKDVSPTKPEQEEKKLSRQEKRAKARLAAREMKKQARNAAMVINRGKGLACLPAAPLATN